MTDLDALLAGIVANPDESLRWLVVADWLDDHGQPDRAELLRLHRMMIDTCCEPDQHPERAAWQVRIVELIDQGVKPCVPQHTLMLPGGVPLVGAFIPPGSFLMGGEESEIEWPPHLVRLTSGFFMGIHPVTQQQWSAVMGTARTSVITYKGERKPATPLSWIDAARFCESLTESIGLVVCLPTEAQWEYACRAGTTTHFHYGDRPEWSRMNFHGKKTWNGSAEGWFRQQATEVASMAPNPWGLFDCHGNVSEWCADWHDPQYYERSPSEDPCCQDDEQVRRAVRGGSWLDHPRECRSASRSSAGPEYHGYKFGFRVAFTLS